MVFSGMECPCRWCKERSIDCHGRCRKYKEWCKLESRGRKKIQATKNAEMLADQDKIAKRIKRRKK